MLMISDPSEMTRNEYIDFGIEIERSCIEKQRQEIQRAQRTISENRKVIALCRREIARLEAIKTKTQEVRS